MTRRHVITAINAVASIGFAYAGLFAAFALWEYGWLHSTFAVSSALSAIIVMWGER